MKGLIVFLLCFSAYAETRTKVAVLDTGVRVTKKIKPYLCKSGHTQFVGNWKEDLFGHGTNIAGLIAESMNPKTHCILVIKIFGFRKTIFNQLVMIGGAHELRVAAGIHEAIFQGAKYINLSMDGGEYNIHEDKAIKRALQNKIHFVLSAGNDDLNLDKNCEAYPVCNNYKSDYIHIVGSPTWRKGHNPYSNKGSIIKYWVDGTNKGEPKLSGTSQSAAILTGRLIRGTASNR